MKAVAFLDAVCSADWDEPQTAAATIPERMTAFLPSEDLRFLMELSVEPVAAGRGLVRPAAVGSAEEPR